MGKTGATQLLAEIAILRQPEQTRCDAGHIFGLDIKCGHPTGFGQTGIVRRKDWRSTGLGFKHW